MTSKRHLSLIILAIMLPLLFLGCPDPNEKDHYFFHMSTRVAPDQQSDSLYFEIYYPAIPGFRSITLNDSLLDFAGRNQFVIGFPPLDTVTWTVRWSDGKYVESLPFRQPIPATVTINDVTVPQSGILDLPIAAETILIVDLRAFAKEDTPPSLPEMEEEHLHIVLQGTNYYWAQTADWWEIDTMEEALLEYTLPEDVPVGDTLTFRLTRSIEVFHKLDRIIHDDDAILEVDASVRRLTHWPRIVFTDGE